MASFLGIKTAVGFFSQDSSAVCIASSFVNVLSSNRFATLRHVICTSEAWRLTTEVRNPMAHPTTLLSLAWRWSQNTQRPACDLSHQRAAPTAGPGR